MSTFTYYKPSTGNASSYLAPGIPFITSSIAPVLDETSAVVNFPRVTNYVVIKNTNETDVGLRVTFNNESVVDNANYFVLDRGESYSGELRTTDVHLMSNGDTPVKFSIVAALTNIDRSEMTQLTPTPPNLLAWVQKQKLIANDPDGSPEGDFFGRVAITGDGRILAAGASSDEENGGASAGCVYIFQNGSDGYRQVQKLTASGDTDPAGDNFGIFVSISSTGETVAAGAWQDEENGGSGAGSVYIFQSGSGGYQQVQKLTASGDADPAGDSFGFRSSLSSAGNILAVAAHFDEENGTPGAGSVYIFQSGSGGYQQVQKLTASGDINPAVDYFGWYVSISSTGETLAVGANGDEENGSGAGSVYIFQSGSGGYQQVQKLTASGDANPAGDEFGGSVSISSTGQILAIGASNDEENGGSQAGSVYIFQSSSLGYQQVQKLTASGDANPAGDQFGYVVSISSTGETIVVGSRSDEENGVNAGSVYIFQSGSLGYQQTNKLTASFGTDGLPEVSPEGDRFGGDFISLNIAGDVIVIGARSDEENGGTNAGSVYIFKYTRDY